MTWLADIDLRAVRGLVGEVTAERSVFDRPEAIVELLERLVGADGVTCDRVDAATGTVSPYALREPRAPAAFEASVSRAEDHALLAAVAAEPDHALRRSDVDRALRRSHADRARRLVDATQASGAYAIAVGMRDGEHDTIVASLRRRERDFSERDRDMLELVAPGLGEALEQARARERTALLLAGAVRAGAALILLDEGGEIQDAMPAGRRWLAEHFGAAEHPGWLPARVARWLALPPRPPLVSVRGARRLVVHLLPGDPHVLLLEETVGRFEPSALSRLGLNRGECEVLGVAAHGCRADDAAPDEGHVEQEAWIAAELFLSLHAVRERLSSAEIKLAVSNRAAAVTRVLRESL